MKLKYSYKTKEEIPQEHAGFYRERDGAFVLEVEGAVEKGRLDEYRVSQAALESKLAELTKAYDGIEPDQARELLKKQREIEEGELVKKGDIEGIVQKRLSAFKSTLENLQGEKNALEAKLADIQINQAALTAGTKRGIRSSAVPDLLNRARNAFRLVNGSAVAVEAGGNGVRYGKDGVRPMSFDEWVEGLVTEAPHLFEENSGGGALGGGGIGVNAGFSPGMRNPWKAETFNLTEQGKITKHNPVLASAMRKAAGR